jgi:hypothetical protein
MSLYVSVCDQTVDYYSDYEVEGYDVEESMLHDVCNITTDYLDSSDDVLEGVRYNDGC